MKDDIERLELEFSEAIRTLPEIPSLRVLRFLSDASYSVPSHVQDKGKELQRIHGLPFVAEYEWAAGLWSVIREALIAEHKNEKP